MKLTATTIAIAAALLWGSYPEKSAANQCGDLSPLLGSMGDDYFHVEDADFNEPNQYERSHENSLRNPVIARLLSTTYRSGTGQRTQCYGSGDSLSARTSDVELEDIYVESNSVGRLKTDYRKSPQITVLKLFEYDESTQRIRAQSVSIPADAIYQTDANRVETLESNTRRRQGTLQGSIFREESLRATYTNHKLIIQQSLYVNGALAEWVTWQLDE